MQHTQQLFLEALKAALQYPGNVWELFRERIY